MALCFSTCMPFLVSWYHVEHACPIHGWLNHSKFTVLQPFNPSASESSTLRLENWSCSSLELNEPFLLSFLFLCIDSMAALVPCLAASAIMAFNCSLDFPSECSCFLEPCWFLSCLVLQDAFICSTCTCRTLQSPMTWLLSSCKGHHWCSLLHLSDWLWHSLWNLAGPLAPKSLPWSCQLASALSLPEDFLL